MEAIATLTVYSNASDGEVVTFDATTYSNAREGTGSFSVFASAASRSEAIGQDNDFNCAESFFSFNTSSLPDGTPINSAVLSLFGFSDESTTDFTLEARTHDWGASLTETDWVAGSQLGTKTLVATFASSGWSTAGYNDFTEDAAFVTEVNDAGPTRLVVSSDRHRLGTTPTGTESVGCYFGDNAGTSKDPKLVVTYGTSHHGGAVLQAVFDLSAAGSVATSARATLRAVFTLKATPSGLPALDFSKYDAYIQGSAGNQGLIFHEQEGARPSTLSTELQPTRTDVGNNPSEIRPEDGYFFAQADFSHGAGQSYFHQPGRDERKYLSSEGFDISKPGKLTHLRDTAEAVNSLNVGALAQAAGLPFVVDGTQVKKGDGVFPGTWTNEDPSAAETDTTVLDLTSKGDELFAALAAQGVHKRSSAGVWAHYQPDGATDLAVGNATRVAWVKDRLMVVGQNGRDIYEIAGSSTPAPIETLPEGWVFEDLFEAGGFIYACAVNTNAHLSRIHHYGLNSAGSAIEKKGSTPLPHGQLAFSGAGYLNVAYIGVGKSNDSGGFDPIVYQAFPDDNGFLDLAKLVEEEGSGSTDLSVRAIEPLGETILLGWSLGTGSTTGSRDGLAIHHLKRDAFAYHLRKPGAAAPARILDIMTFKGRVLFSISGDGLYYEDLANYVASAELVPSIADWNNAGLKTWDLIEISHKPLPTVTSIEVDYTSKHPEEASWTDAFPSATLDAEGASTRLSNLKSRLFDLRITSKASTDQSLAPEFLGFSVRSHPTVGTPEYTLTRFARIIERDRKDENAEVVYQDPEVVLESLQDLLYTWVTFYEPGATWTARVKSVGSVEPAQPLMDATGGEPRKKAHLIQIVMVGTRG